MDASVAAAWPVGSVFISVVATSPATLLGFGTWAAIGAGKMLMGWNTGDTLEATGGAATHGHTASTASESAHTHTYSQTVNHVHVQTVNSATTGGLSGYTPDTSSNTPAVSGYSTQNPTGGVATGTTAAGAGHSHAATVADGSNVPPYLIVRMWKRTA